MLFYVHISLEWLIDYYTIQIEFKPFFETSVIKTSVIALMIIAKVFLNSKQVLSTLSST